MRRNSLPQKPEDYKLENSKEFKIPDGIEFKWNGEDKSLQGFRAWAQKAGLTQEQFSQALDLYAGNTIAQTQALKDARAAELGKLGATADARIASVKTFLNGFLGDADAAVLTDTLWTAGIVQGFEKLITKIASGHGSSFSQANRDGGGKQVDDATYNGWSVAQRMNYSRTGDPNKAAA